MLAGIDALVFDLQDVGTRAYTYISTMALAMQAAAENNKLFVVLDRPNPLGGERVDGPVLDRDHEQLIVFRSEEHTSELQSQSNLVCRLLLEKKKKNINDIRLTYISQ